MNRELVGLQKEIGRLHRALAERERQLHQLNAEAQRLQQQGQQVEREKITALTWMLGLLLEHHGGEALLAIPLLNELADGQETYGTRTAVAKDGLNLKITVVDGAGNQVEKASHELRQAAAAGARIIQAHAAAEGEEEKAPVCGCCGRKSPGHNLDCERRKQ